MGIFYQGQGMGEGEPGQARREHMAADQWSPAEFAHDLIQEQYGKQLTRMEILLSDLETSAEKEERLARAVRLMRGETTEITPEDTRALQGYELAYTRDGMEREEALAELEKVHDLLLPIGNQRPVDGD